MDVGLLRSDITKALNELDEETRIGRFWSVAQLYDDCVPVFKIIFLNEKIGKIITNEYEIEKINGAFLIRDSRGEQDTFTNHEIGLLIDLWEKAQRINVNEIRR